MCAVIGCSKYVIPPAPDLVARVEWHNFRRPDTAPFGYASVGRFNSSKSPEVLAASGLERTAALEASDEVALCCPNAVSPGGRR